MANNNEIWLVTEIYPKDNNQIKKLVLDFIKPTVESLEIKHLIDTFHFFFEPQLLFRIRTADVDKRNEAKSVVNLNLAQLKDNIKKSEVKEDYTGEHKDFGTEGWIYVQKLFEYASRISLLKMETLSGKKSYEDCCLNGQFNDGKLVHCFLNAQGFNTFDEAAFHNRVNFERLSMAYGFFNKSIEVE
jgi:hypothetical protein